VAAEKKAKTRKDPKPPNTGWLQIIESEPPRFFCPLFKRELTSPCQLHGCALWTPNRKVYSCAGAFGGMKAANSEERLQSTSLAQREKRGTLRSAAEGKFSFYDMAHIFSLTRQRVEGFVAAGRQIAETLSPLVADINLTSDRNDPPKRRLGSPTVFTYSSPTSHVDNEGEIWRVCICCECVIEPDDPELVLAILDRTEIAWCSRECAKELPIDAYLVSDRYKRHYSSVALKKDPVDERSRVREITPQRMEVLANLAKKQGFS
jgi:hypothetical protein